VKGLGSNIQDLFSYAVLTCYADMKIFFSLCYGLCIFLAQASWAQSGKYQQESADFLGLKNDSFNYSKQSMLEFWAYQNGYGDSNLSDTYKLRFYQPLSINQWQGMLRLDTTYSSFWGPGDPGQSSGQFSAGNTLLTIWGKPPSFLSGWDLNLGGRIIFPFGNNGQWALGPQISAVFVPYASNTKAMLADFSPLVRYMYGFDTKNNSVAAKSSQPPLLRSLQLYPSFGLQLSKTTQLRFWDENGLIYNTAGGGWFVPVDAMLTQSLNKNLLFAFGASKQIIQTYQSYDWSIYGKVSLRF